MSGDGAGLRAIVAKAIREAPASQCDCESWPNCRHQDEADADAVLAALRAAGEIADLEIQPRYPLVVNGVKVATYVADYRYRDVRTGEVRVEDVKGKATLLYTVKKNLMRAIYGIDVTEVAA